MESRLRMALLKLISIYAILTFSFVGCIVSGDSGSRSQNAEAGFSNSPSTLARGRSRVLLTNPVVQSGNPALPSNTNLSRFLSSSQFITNNNRLSRECQMEDPLNPGATISVTPCMEVFQEPNFNPTAPINGRWGFETNTNEFLEVHTYFHLSRAIDTFLGSYTFAYEQGWLNPAIAYDRALPNNLVSSGSFWFNSMSLQAYSSCQEFANATFDPVNFSICFGIDPDNEGLVFSQDASVIYHEVGHAFVKVMMNSRNRAAGISSTLTSDLGILFYDEAGSINEGIADYFSYVFGNRTRMGEWALGTASRPVSEEDEGHLSGIDITPGGRLAYPTFINYDSSANSTTSIEDVHFLGQIASHFLVALTESLKDDCNQTHEIATRNMIHLLAETLAELGDLTSRGKDSTAIGENYVNLQQSSAQDFFSSYRWAHIVNPPNFRRFFQVFSKYFLQIFVQNPSCNLTTYSKDAYEELLDSYGLLLFESYNEDGNGQNGTIASGHQGFLNGTNTFISTANRRRTVKVSKDLIDFDPDSSVDAFIFDDRADLIDVVGALRFAGSTVNFSPLIPTGLGFNNGNGQISPGELVGVALNLHSSANTDIGGIQVLANDWDHAKLDPITGEFNLCNTFEDNFPLSTEGAANVSGEANPVEGDCGHITRENGTENELLAPICWVQSSVGTSTQWVSQNVFRQQIGLEDSNCLHQNGHYNNCLISAVSGADTAYFSRIAPGQTWSETVVDADGDPRFSLSNLILFEVNTNIPPATRFDCRFRVRATNCSDCFEDPNFSNDDYLDFEYSGGDPYKILHLQFVVND